MSRQPTTPQPEFDPNDAGPENIDEFRDKLTRIAATIIGEHLSCPELRCRRARHCMGGPEFTCVRHSSRPPVSEEEGNRRIAFLQRALRQRIAEQGGEP